MSKPIRNIHAVPAGSGAMCNLKRAKGRQMQMPRYVNDVLFHASLLLVISLLLHGCGSGSSSTHSAPNYGSVTLTPSNGGSDVVFSPTVNSNSQGASFVSTWHIPDPATATSGRYLTMNITESVDVVDHVDFIDRPEFTNVLQDAYYYADCNYGVPCFSSTVVLDKAHRQITFTGFTVTLYIDHTGLANPSSYVINGVLKY